MKEEDLEKLFDNNRVLSHDDKNFDAALHHISSLHLKSKLEPAWIKFATKINTAPPVESENKNRKYIVLGWLAAACAVGFIFGFIFYSNSAVQNTTKMAEQKNLFLPDGSFVFMNADSKINFNKAEWLFNRRLFLEGEAFFDVAKGEKFEVNTRFGQVIVKGTKFNVKNRLHYFEVNCIEGKVLVLSKGKEILLTKGLSTKIDFKDSDQLTAAYYKNLAPCISWIKGDITFDGEALERVIEEMERQFDIKFEIRTSIDKKYTGKFNIKNLDETLELVFKPLGVLVHRKNDNTFVLYN